MSLVFIPTAAQQPLPVNGYVRNGKVPDDQYAAGMAIGANQTALLRGKEIFRAAGMLKKSTGIALPDSGGTGTRTRWRFYGHTSPFCVKVHCAFILAQQNDGNGFDGPPNGPKDCFGRLDLGTFGTADFHYGTTSINADDAPAKFGIGFVSIPVTGNTDIPGAIIEGNSARIVACTVYEEQLLNVTQNGYIPEVFAAQAPIMDADRSNLSVISSLNWLRGAAHTLNWSVDLDANKVTNATATVKNVIDNATTVSASTPGFTLDMRNRSRYRTPGTVDIVIAAYGACTSATHGVVALRDSGGATVASSVGFGVSPAWVVATGTIPSTLAKYDLGFSTSVGSLDLYAVSVFEFL